MSNQLVNLPATAGELLNAPTVLNTFLLPDNQRKLALDINFLGLVARANPKLKTEDFVHYVQLAQLTGADPRRKQIHLVTFNKNAKYKDQNTNQWVDNWIVTGEAIFSYHFFLEKATSTGELELLEVDTQQGSYVNPVTDQQFNTIVSIATIVRKGRKFTYKAWLPEFIKTNNQGQATQAWATKPYMMLEKCAIANVLRWAFPDALGGMYIQEEMPEGDRQDLSGGGHVYEVPFNNKQPREADTSSQKGSGPGGQGEGQKHAQEGQNQGQNQPGGPIEGQVLSPNNEAETGQKQAGQKGRKNAKNNQSDNRPTDNQQGQSYSGGYQASQGHPVPPSNEKNLITQKTKAMLWAAIQRVGMQSRLDTQKAIAKMNQMTLTEDLGQQLINGLNNGDVSLFA